MGLSIIFSAPKSPASRSTAVLSHSGVHSLAERVGDNIFTYGLTSFFQVNIPLFEQALATIAQSIDDAESIVDMYAGVGTIGISLSAQKVTLVEIDPTAIPFAKENAVSNERANAELIHAPAEKALEEIVPNATIIFDPPRVGLHPKVLERTIEVLPPKIVYLSCNATTQARDMSALVAAGYHLELFEAYNFFPRTPHTEMLAILRQ